MEQSEIAEGIVGLIRKKRIFKAGDVDPGLPLGARYGLDSAGLIALVVALEQEFGIEFEAEDMQLENFSTVNQIAGLIRERLDRRSGRP